MMKHYEKPDILRVDNLNEGVYLASGDPVCGSKYLMGNWIKPSRGTSQGERLQVWGCEGCPADDGNGCKIKKGEMHDIMDYRPNWEKNGLDPTKLHGNRNITKGTVERLCHFYASNKSRF